MTTIWIRGTANAQGFLRMDGSGVTSFSPGGGGHVDCVFAPEALTEFFIVENLDGTVNIESVAFPGVFLRMDGRGVTSWTWGGAGSVNCQFGAGPWETFLLKPVNQVSEGPPPLGFFNIESVAFPNVYLRIDGIPGAFNSPGTVNCQFTTGAWEQLLLDLVNPQPEAVPVPDVLNDSPDKARALIEAAGFRFSSIGIPVKGTLTPFVESQNPPGGLLALVGITVGVTIAEPVMGIVPDVLNESPSSASSKIEAAGFQYSGSADPVEGSFKPYVEFQDPDGGTQAPQGSTVNVTVAVPVRKGPPQDNR